MGRPHTPTETKKARGTYRPDRDPARISAQRGANIAQRPGEFAQPPRDMTNDEEIRAFEEIVAEMSALGSATARFSRMIAHVARLEVRAAAMREELAGDYVMRATSREGDMVIKSNAALAQLSTIESAIVAGYAALGLLPNTFDKVPKNGPNLPGSKPANAFAEFAQ